MPRGENGAGGESGGAEESGAAAGRVDQEGVMAAAGEPIAGRVLRSKSRLRSMGWNSPVAGGADFSGFEEDLMEGPRVHWIRKVNEMEKFVMDLVESQTELRNKIEGLETKQRILEEENKELRKQIDKGVKEVKNEINSAEETRKNHEKALEEQKEESNNLKESVKVLQDEQSQWIKIHEEDKTSFRDIIKAQREEVAQTVVKVIKQKENLIRDTVDRKKCVLVFGVKEEKLIYLDERKEQEKKAAERVMKELEDEDRRFVNQIEEVTRIGKYVEGGSRPLRIKFQAQSAVEDVLVRTHKLAKKEEFNMVWVKRDYSLEEREKIKELWKDADEKTRKDQRQRKKSFGGRWWT